MHIKIYIKNPISNENSFRFSFAIFFSKTAKPAPLRNCTLRPYSSPSSVATTAILSNSTSNLPPPHPFYVGNQNVNAGQHLKELNYITTEYVKDKNLLDDRRKYISSKQSNTHQHHQQSNGSLSNARYQQQGKNNTNNINFSDNKSNDRYKSNLKSLKRHTTRSESVREVKSSSNDTKHVNFNKRTASVTTFVENQYRAGDSEQPTISHLRSSSTVSKYHMPSAINSNSYSPYANSVHSETVEQPTLMELECIAGYDGGLPQYFFLEAYDSRTRKLRLNITSALNDVPLFRIDLAGIEKKLHQN
jgi:hypothetical protein